MNIFLYNIIMNGFIYKPHEIKEFLIKFPYYHYYVSNEYNLDKDPKKMGVFNTDNEIIVVGDIHGDLVTFVNLLIAIELIKKEENQYKWIGGNKYLVQTGDILDRKRFMDNADEGDNPLEELEIIMFLFDLNTQACEAGGRVIPVIGNHELMNLCGDFRYVSEHHMKGCNTLTGIQNGRKYLFSHNPRLYTLSNNSPKDIKKILCEMKGKLRFIFYRFFYPIVKINDWIFVHAGLPIKLVNKWSKNTISIINNIYKQYVYTDDSNMELAYNDLFGDNGIFWTRKYGTCKGDGNCKPCEDLDNILQTLNGSLTGGMVVGHTVKEAINGKCNDRLWCIDIALSKGFHDKDSIKNKEQCLQITGNNVTVIG
tara:strand:+ start:476 stop:1579 length:1104 start_codon:yes stop_codon:yes gene_type:complete